MASEPAEITEVTAAFDAMFTSKNIFSLF